MRPFDPKTCLTDATGVTVCLPPVDVVCYPPPLLWRCSVNGICSCQMPDVPREVRLCTVSIVYPSNNPLAPQLVPMEPWCSAAGLEIAVSIMLSKCLAGLVTCGTP